MPLLIEPGEIRSLLQHDRIWCVYALGDLSPALFPKTQWFSPDLTLVLHDYGTCILFAVGESSIAEALLHVQWPVHLQVQAPALEAIERHAHVAKRQLMFRMAWRGSRAGWVDATRARRLTMADVPALERLYADGAPRGESPDFFFPSMVADGVFFGVCDGSEILSVAGTHLYAPAEGAAAIGNVYTHSSHRGRGLGKIATCATLAELAHLETVGLNVRAGNAPALKVYESLGFRTHCEFFEGLATALR